jgi:predicted ABC-type ATPase
VNADAIAQGLSAFQPETVAFAAGRVMLARLRALAAARDSFAFETTLASRNFAPWLRTLKTQGFKVHMAFLSLPTADLAVARVAERVRQGGHDVPTDVIRRRFAAGLLNFFTLFLPVADSWQMFDNSGTAGPRLIAGQKPGADRVVFDEAAWHRLEEAGR